MNNGIDRKGEIQGYNIDLARKPVSRVPVLKAFIGGPGKVSRSQVLLVSVGVVAADIGTMLVFKGQLRAVLITYE